MKNFKKTAILLIVLFIGFWIWYEYTYSMDTVIPLEMNDSNLDTKVLIASQGSKFKDSLAQGILRNYKNDTIYFKVIDAYTLFTVNIDKWDALIIINSWEYGSPPRNIKKFLKNHPDQSNKLIILSTVGSYNKIFDKIDILSGESIISKVPHYTKIVVKQLNQIIKKNE
ncbi:hypothetical protein AB832_03450 [Flavobacteriaceae bacterium (ex Bugula neritina AB1)]|nr:hypothetical protein AB832_03450 [Flavobacteriaceae bacterium (ex Bugula neritina AB1)]